MMERTWNSGRIFLSEKGVSWEPLSTEMSLGGAWWSSNGAIWFWKVVCRFDGDGRELLELSTAFVDKHKFRSSSSTTRQFQKRDVVWASLRKCL